MSILIYQNDRIAGAAAATLIAARVIAQPSAVIGFDMTAELRPIYQALGKMTFDGMLDWSDIKAYSLSEHVKSDAGESIRSQLDACLYSRINLQADNIHAPDANASDWSEACSRYESSLLQAGGLDMAVISIGADGSMAYNLPSGELAPVTHVERTADGRVVTLGISSLMHTRQIVACLTGTVKAAIAERVINGPVCPEIPASYLQLHPNAVIILDEAAASSVH